MPFCSDIDLTIDMDRDSDGTLLDSLFFHLIINGGVINRRQSTVSTSTGSPLSRVSGTCRAVANPDVSVINMEFTWDSVNVFMAGVIYRNPGPNRVEFLGRFHAFRPTRSVARKSADKKSADAQLLEGPGDGDTGTGTGQQT